MIYKVLNEKVKTHTLIDVHKSIVMDDTDYISFASGNAFESLARTYPELFNDEKLRSIRDGENIVEEFNKYFMDIISGEIDRFSAYGPDVTQNMSGLSKMNIFLINVLNADYNALKEEIGEKEARLAITEMYIPESLSEEGCKRLINIRLNNSKFLSECITTMIKYNYLELGISSAEANELINAMKDTELAPDAYKKIKAILSDPKVIDKYRINGTSYDFRSIGGACIFLSADPSVQNAEVPTKHLFKMFKYDAIVVAHGGYTTSMYGNPFKYLRDGNSRNWFVQPVSTLTKKNLQSVVDVVRALKKEGFKNVFIGSCNPGHVMLPDDIIKDPNFTVTIGLDSVLMENTDMSINEGLLDRAKSFFKNSVSAFVKAFTDIKNRFRNLTHSIDASYSSKFGANSRVKLPKDISIGYMYIENGKPMYKVETASSVLELKSIVENANRTLINYVDKLTVSEYRNLDTIYNKTKTTYQNGDSNMFESVSIIGSDPGIEYKEELFFDKSIMN